MLNLKIDLPNKVDTINIINNLKKFKSFSDILNFNSKKYSKNIFIEDDKLKITYAEFNILVNLVNKESVLLLHKGKNWQKEIAESKKGWQFDYNIVKNDIVLDRSGGVTIEVMNLLRK